MLIETSNRFATPIDDIEDLIGDMDKTNQALEYYQKTKLAFERVGLEHTARYGHLLFCLSVLYEMQGNIDLAREYSKAAFASYEKVGYNGIGYNGIWKEKARSRAEKLRTHNARLINY
jgi:hypothetical protein